MDTDDNPSSSWNTEGWGASHHIIHIHKPLLYLPTYLVTYLHTNETNTPIKIGRGPPPLRRRRQRLTHSFTHTRTHTHLSYLPTYIPNKQPTTTNLPPTLSYLPTNETNHQNKQALARLRFDDAVNVSDVEEAIRLTRMSKVRRGKHFWVDGLY